MMNMNNILFKIIMLRDEIKLKYKKKILRWEKLIKMGVLPRIIF